MLSHPDARRIGSACFGSEVPGWRVVSSAAWSGRRGGCGGEGGAGGPCDPCRWTSGAAFPSGQPIRLPLALGHVPGTSLLAPTKRCSSPKAFAVRTRLVGIDAAIGRLVPSGFRFGSGGASPSAWRFQELVSCQARGLEGSMPEQSLPRVMWSLDGSSSDDCAPLAASAVRRVRSEDHSCGFSDTARGHRCRPDRSILFRAISGVYS